MSCQPCPFGGRSLLNQRVLAFRADGTHMNFWSTTTFPSIKLALLVTSIAGLPSPHLSDQLPRSWARLWMEALTGERYAPMASM